MLTNKEFIISVPCSDIIESTVGNKYAYFISDKK